MGLLDGRKALIFGVANDHSIAWGIAQALHEDGATVGFSSVESLIEKRVSPPGGEHRRTFVEPCDVRDDAQSRRVFDPWGARRGRPRHPGPRPRLRATRGPRRPVRGHVAGRLRARPGRLRLLAGRPRPRGRPLLRPGASILTLTYYGAEKVVANYNVMGVAKAALEACVRYLAADLGRTASGSTPSRPGRCGRSPPWDQRLQDLHGSFREVAPLRSTSPSRTSAGTAVCLASDLSRQVTGETIYVDGGFNIIAVPTPEE